MNRFNSWRMMWMVGMLAAVLLAGGEAWATTYEVGSGKTYSSITGAVEAARSAGGGPHIVRIMDSATYSECVVLNSTSFNNMDLTVEATNGVTPKLYGFDTGGSVSISNMNLTLRGLAFDENLATTPVLLGGVQVGKGADTRFSGNVTIENCSFTNAASTSWTSAGIYVRMASATYKVTIKGCDFNFGNVVYAGYAPQACTTDPRGHEAEIYDCVFRCDGLSGRGINDFRSRATTGGPALKIHNNLFYGIDNAYNNQVNAILATDYLVITNNTFVKCGGSGSAASQGAIVIRFPTNIAAVINNNLFVGDGAALGGGGHEGIHATFATNLNANYNAFVKMTNNYVGYFVIGSAGLRTVSDLNGLASAENNQINNTLAPGDLFANYGGANYRKDYRLKTGVWALTAASEGGYVGAFGLEVPAVTVTANDGSASETGPDNGQFTISRGSRTDGDLTVNYTLPVSGSATPGSDTGGDYTTTPAMNYGARTGSVTIPDTATNVTVTVTPVDDGDTELSETVVLLLAASADYGIGSPSSNIVTIADNDAGGNIPPAVSAGANKTVVSNSLPASTGLEGSATDADNGPTTPMTYEWAKVSGPGSVTFGAATVTNTTASFGAAGAYVLSLSAYDGADTRSNTVTITVYDNEAPTVNAGVDQSGTLVSTLNLDGTVTVDDGLPASPALTYLWSQDSGTGTAVFGNSTNIDTTVTFDQVGEYVLKLTATDGLGLSGSDTVTVQVRDVVTLAAKANGAFNVVTTWDPEMNPMPGDTMNITGYTVTNLVANGVVGTVNLSGSATLWLANLGALGSPAAVGATINVGTGATLRLNGANNAINCTNVNLNGGTLAFNDGSLEAGSVLRVNNDSLITPISGKDVNIAAVVHGSGKLTLTASGALSGSACAFAVGSTWNGAWDIQGYIRMDGSASSRNMPGDVRVAPGQELRFNSAGPHVFKGTRSGGGTNSAYLTSNFRVGDGTGNGKMSPGDSGAGNVTIANYGGASPVTLTFNTNSTYEVDVAGATSSLYDSVTVVGGVGSNGIVRLLSGSILTVRMAEPPAGTKSVDVKIIDTVKGSGGDGLLIGDFGVTNWVNAGGWTGLGVIKVGEDLHVQGSFGGSGTLLMVQ